MSGSRLRKGIPPDHRARRLTVSDVKQIRRRYRKGGSTYRSLGIEYGVSRTSIQNAVIGRTFLWVPDNRRKVG